MKSKRWVQASAPSYDGDDWDDDYYSGDDAPELPELPEEHAEELAEVSQPEAPAAIKPLALGRAGQKQKQEEERMQAAELERQYQQKLAEEKRQREQLEELEREQERLRAAREKAEAEAKAAAEAERQERLEIEREYRERQELARREEEAEREAEAKAKAEAERAAAAEAARLEAAEQAKRKAAAEAAAEAERAKKEAERKAAAEAERAKKEAERKAAVEAERVKKEAERAAKEKAERTAKVEAARIEAEKQAKMEADRKAAAEAKMEAERLAELEAAEQLKIEAERQARLEAELEQERQKESERQEAQRLVEAERLEAEREAEYQAKLEARAKEAEKAHQAEEAEREAEQARLEAERHALMSAAGGEESPGFYDSRAAQRTPATKSTFSAQNSPHLDHYSPASPRDPYDPSNHTRGFGYGSAETGTEPEAEAATASGDNNASAPSSFTPSGIAAGVTAAAASAAAAAAALIQGERSPVVEEESTELKHASTIPQIDGDDEVSAPGTAGTSSGMSHARMDSVEDIVADYYAYSSEEDGVEDDRVYDEEGVEEGATMDEPKSKKESSPESTDHEHYADAEDVEEGYTMDGVKIDKEGGDSDDEKASDAATTTGAAAVAAGAVAAAASATPRLDETKREIPPHLVPGTPTAGRWNPSDPSLTVGTSALTRHASDEVTPTTEMNKLSDEIMNSFSADTDPYYSNSAYDYEDSDAVADPELHALYAGTQKFLDTRMSRDMTGFSVAPLSPKRLSRVPAEFENTESLPTPKIGSGSGPTLDSELDKSVDEKSDGAAASSGIGITGAEVDEPDIKIDAKDLEAKQHEPLPSIPTSSLDPGPALPPKISINGEDDGDKDAEQEAEKDSDKTGSEHQTELANKDTDENRPESRSSSPELDEFQDAVERIPTNERGDRNSSSSGGYKSMILATSLENVANVPSSGAGASSRSGSRGAGVVGKQGSISSMSGLGKTESVSSVAGFSSSSGGPVAPSVSTGAPSQAPSSFAKQATTTAVLPKGPAITTAQIRTGPSYDFRSILTRPRSVDRANAFDDARKREAEYSPGLESWLVFTYNALKTDAGISGMQTSGSYSGGSNNLPRASGNILAGSIGEVFQNPMSGATKVSEKSSQVLNKVGESTSKRARGLFAKSKKLMKGDR